MQQSNFISKLQWWMTRTIGPIILIAVVVFLATRDFSEILDYSWTYPLIGVGVTVIILLIIFGWRRFSFTSKFLKGLIIAVLATGFIVLLVFVIRPKYLEDSTKSKTASIQNEIELKLKTQHLDPAMQEPRQVAPYTGPQLMYGTYSFTRGVPQYYFRQLHKDEYFYQTAYGSTVSMHFQSVEDASSYWDVTITRQADGHVDPEGYIRSNDHDKKVSGFHTLTVTSDAEIVYNDKPF